METSGPRLGTRCEEEPKHGHTSVPEKLITLLTTACHSPSSLQQQAQRATGRQNRAEFSGQVGRVGSIQPVCLSSFVPLFNFLSLGPNMAAQCEESERSCCLPSLKLRSSTLTSKCNIPNVAAADRRNRGSGPNAPSPGAAHPSPVTPVTHNCCIKEGGKLSFPHCAHDMASHSCGNTISQIL